MKRFGAVLVTLGLLGAVAWFKSGTMQSSAHESPDECVQTMFQTAMAGDVQGYLRCFSESARLQVQRELSADSASGSEALRKSMSGLKGWAVVDPPASQGKSVVNLTIEWIYATRVDRQQLELERGSQGWQISKVHRVRPGQPAIPYGTPVFATPP